MHILFGEYSLFPVVTVSIFFSKSLHYVYWGYNKQKWYEFLLLYCTCYTSFTLLAVDQSRKSLKRRHSYCDYPSILALWANNAVFLLRYSQ